MAKIFNRDVVFGAKIQPKGELVTAVSGAVTAIRRAGVITTASLTTAAGAIYTLTITNTKILASSIVLVSVALGSSSAGVPVLNSVTPADGSVVIKISNEHASAALNGTLKVSFFVLDQDTS